MTRVIASLVAAALLGVPGHAIAQSGYDLFQQALVKERLSGQLREAMELYQRIVNEHGADRSLTAKALVQLGRAYESLSSPSAQVMYERVQRDYADQNESAVVARARLAALQVKPGRAATGRGAVVRLVWGEAANNTLIGPPSPDGRYVPHMDHETGSLMVRDLATVTSRTIAQGSWNRPGGSNTGRAAFSPDGRQIAYSWEPGFDLRVSGVDGSATRTIYRHEEFYTEPRDWTSDGQRILTLVTRRDRTSHIAFVPAEGGPLAILRSLDWRPGERRMRLSPDGRFVAYSFPPADGVANRDIFVLATDGSRENHAISHPADDYVIGFAPDGERLVFASNRTGRLDAWALRLKDGEPVGAPELVRAEIAGVPLGLTPDGTLYTDVYSGWNDVLTATLDPATGALLQPPTPVMGQFEGSNSAPDWSADGRYLASRSTERRLLIRDMESEVVRQIQPVFGNDNFHYLRWSPDGRTFLTIGRDPQGRYGSLIAIDAQTGSAEVVARPEEESGSLHTPEWARDGRSLFFTRVRPGRTGIVRMDLSSKVERELYAGVSRINAVAVAPDGRQLAFVEAGAIKVIPADSGAAQLVTSDDGIRTMTWMSDGALLYGKTVSAANDTTEVWRAAISDGTKTRTGLTGRNLVHLRAHPDGRRVAFTAAVRSEKRELWAMEGFLLPPPRR